MTNKTLKKKVPAKPAISKFTAPVVDSARDIWLAGLGAFSVAQAESGKLVEQGNKLFDKLVSEGTKLEKKTRNEAKTAAGDIRNDVESRIDAVRQQVTQNWTSLASIFDGRVVSTLDRLGVPTTSDLDRLSAQVKKASRKAAKNWQDLESVFDQRVTGVLGGLGLPTSEDTSKLAAELEKLSRQVSAMQQKVNTETKATTAAV